jgi:hypothetical protein
VIVNGTEIETAELEETSSISMPVKSATTLISDAEIAEVRVSGPYTMTVMLSVAKSAVYFDVSNLLEILHPTVVLV